MKFAATCGLEHQPIPFDDPEVLEQHLRATHPKRLRLVKPRNPYMDGPAHRTPRPGKGEYAPKFGEAGARIEWREMVPSSDAEHGYEHITRAGTVWSRTGGPGHVYVIPDEPFPDELCVVLRIRRSAGKVTGVEHALTRFVSQQRLFLRTLAALSTASHLVVTQDFVAEAGGHYHRPAPRVHLPECWLTDPARWAEDRPPSEYRRTPRAVLDYLLGRGSSHGVSDSATMCPDCLPVNVPEPAADEVAS